jgi:hypothetical protein
VWFFFIRTKKINTTFLYKSKKNIITKMRSEKNRTKLKK